MVVKKSKEVQTDAEGVLVVDKPTGVTSHDVVRQARRMYQTRSIGHAGTLDPMASGVVVLMIGEATKLCPYLTGQDKTYRATVDFSSSTDTWDREGVVTLTALPQQSSIDLGALEEALDAERHRIEQHPPAFSAIKVDGIRAYHRARRGVSMKLKSRPVRVLDLVLERWQPPCATVYLTVTKGYYVRSLAHDLGEHLGVPAHLSELRRLASGQFTLEGAVPWPDRRNLDSGPRFPAPALLPMAQAAQRALGCVRLTDRGERRARVGQQLDADDFWDTCPEQTAAWIGADGRLVALGRKGEDGGYRVVRGFSPGHEG